MNAVRPRFISFVVYASDVRKIWLDLRERFDTINRSRILQSYREIHTLVQGTMSIVDYHSKLRDIWDEYDSLMPCPSCPCLESKNFGEHCDYQRLLQFLMVLNESYSPPMSQILMMIPIPTLNKAYALLIDHESQKKLVVSSTTSGVIEGTALYFNRSGASTSKGSAGSTYSSNATYKGSAGSTYSGNVAYGYGPPSGGYSGGVESSSQN